MRVSSHGPTDRSTSSTASLLVHHLEPRDAIAFLREAGRVARLGVIVNDLVRARRNWVAARAGLPIITRNRFTRHDGPMSVQRSYTRVELRALLAGAEPAAGGGGRRAVRAPGGDRGRVDARVPAARTAARGAPARGTRAAAARMTAGQARARRRRDRRRRRRGRGDRGLSRAGRPRGGRCSSARRRGAGGQAACSPRRRRCASCDGWASMPRRSNGSRGPSQRCAWSRPRGTAFRLTYGAETGGGHRRRLRPVRAGPRAARAGRAGGRDRAIGRAVRSVGLRRIIPGTLV